MKVYPKIASDYSLTEPMHEALITYRKFRNFKPEEYINLKAKVINEYFRKYSLKGAVVGVSGGVDSAAVLSLIKFASTQKNSPISKITPVFMPVFNASATNQQEAQEKASALVGELGLDLVTIDLSETHRQLSAYIETQIKLTSNDWAKGQFVAHCRTPSLYYCATLLTAQNIPSIIIGTTNKDEGNYLGYVGKASDGLVDLQIISDLHKSEVFSIAQYLKVPSSILSAIPHGDLFDGRSDVELFGASYDFVELYHYYKQLPECYPDLIVDSKFAFFAHNLESLHSYNRHKYFSCSPAVHLDIISDIAYYPECARTNMSFGNTEGNPLEKNRAVEFFISLNQPFLGLKFPVYNPRLDSFEVSSIDYTFGLYESLF